MERWSMEKAKEWFARTPWQVGVNYVPSGAVNDVEMWMDGTFDPWLIGRETRLAARAGFNALRVFLSYTVWEREKELFLRHFEEFLTIAADAGLRVMPVLFDDCAFDNGSEAYYGRQPEPVPGVHNSRWVPSPGFSVQDDPEKEPSLREYVSAVVGAHREDGRILMWDLFNEPGNTDRTDKAVPLLKNAFLWARAESPVQPLTAAVWSFSPQMEAVEKVCIAESDILSMHAYLPLEETKRRYALLEAEGRPVFLTEWLHRGVGNTYETHLPFFHEKKLGIFQWGLVIGRTQTNLSWDTMRGTPDPEPALWQHDLLLPDGTAYRETELALIRFFRGMEQ